MDQHDPVVPAPRGPRLSPREKAAQSPGNPKLAIAAYCYHECNNEEAANSHVTKVAVRDCGVTGCALWPFRGWQHITGGLVGKRK